MAVIIPTIRIICDICGDDMQCTEKSDKGYAYQCPRCNIHVHMLGGWASSAPIRP